MAREDAIIVTCMIIAITDIRIIGVQHPKRVVVHLQTEQVVNQLQAVRRQILRVVALQRIIIVLWILMMMDIMISMKMTIMTIALKR